ncbi:MAG: EAL domain-containing protein [Longimicrobiales bacterium]|nr:EAL domain-containing protein [Longimicrobiales bacterium]
MTQLRILVAEDDVLVARDLREALEEMGHVVAAVLHSSDHVVRIAREEEADLALLDVRLPGSLDGIDVARRLRNKLEIPVIFVTAHTDDITLRRARESDPFGYLVKPVDFEELHGAIEVAMERHARERLLREAIREVERAPVFRQDEDPSDPYRTLFRRSPAAITIVSLKDGRILDVNHRFQELFGWRREEAVGETADSLGLWAHGEDRDRLWERVASEGRIHGLRTTLRTRDGEAREVDLSAEVQTLGSEKTLLTAFHDVTAQAATTGELQRMALYDSLTGLPNRDLFRDRLQHALDRAGREGQGVAVLFVDLDGFKAVNDSLGHEAGDEVLELVAQRILGAVRDEDTVARLGGDEFTVILEKDPSRSGAEAVARRIRAAMLPPFQLRGRTVHLTASIGIAITRSGNVTAQELVHSSDMAMYGAKRHGGDRHRVFIVGGNSPTIRGMRLTQDVKRAVAADEIAVSYQPIVTLDSGRVVGAEALVRWDHPERGMLSPGILLTAAEELGLGPAVASRVMDLACEQLAAWRETLPPDFVMSVNLSTFQLSDLGLEDEVTRILESHDVPPEMLMIEIVQEELLQALRTIRGFRERGIRVAVDDFGTGLARFSHFRRLEVDALKLDPSFIAGLEEGKVDAAIIRSIMVLAEGLDLGVVAEGVETAVQRNELLSLGCSVGQGFYFSRPLQPRDFAEFLAESGEGVGTGA